MTVYSYLDDAIREYEELNKHLITDLPDFWQRLDSLLQDRTTFVENFINQIESCLIENRKDNDEKKNNNDKNKNVYDVTLSDDEIIYSLNAEFKTHYIEVEVNKKKYLCINRYKPFSAIEISKKHHDLIVEHMLKEDIKRYNRSRAQQINLIY